VTKSRVTDPFTNTAFHAKANVHVDGAILALAGVAIRAEADGQRTSRNRASREYFRVYSSEQDMKDPDASSYNVMVSPQQLLVVKIDPVSFSGSARESAEDISRPANPCRCSEYCDYDPHDNRTM